jgi:hypothetical protein
MGHIVDLGTEEASVGYQPSGYVKRDTDEFEISGS